MFGEKKTRSKEMRWMLTFADLITLLFCFFVYLSLFNKPQVDIKTGFVVVPPHECLHKHNEKQVFPHGLCR